MAAGISAIDAKTGTKIAASNCRIQIFSARSKWLAHFVNVPVQIKLRRDSKKGTSLKLGRSKEAKSNSR